MSKTKEVEKIQVLRVIPIGNGQEEAALYREVPDHPELYINELRYAPEGTYKVGAFTEPTIQKKAEEEN
jgi:hypothetical protein